MGAPRPVFHLTGSELRFSDGRDSRSESRRLPDATLSTFQSWIEHYRSALAPGAPADDLKTLGRTLYDWLNGTEGWLGRVADYRPLQAEFRTDFPPVPELARTFLELPWELLADAAGFLAARPALRFTPVRRLGAPSKPPPPDAAYALSLTFMAAAPRGTHELDYEAEEAAILDAAEGQPLDLMVEESGALAPLADRLARIQGSHVLHLSCHGLPAQTDGTPPALALEDATGAVARTEASALILGLGAHGPRLAFLSACHSAAGTAPVTSLAHGLIEAEVPAVLGWSGAVGDHDASRFAAHLYHHLARKTAVEDAVAFARTAVLTAQDGGGASGSAGPARDWHLARLTLGPEGGGMLAVGTRLKGRTDPKYGLSAVLDADGKVKVAGRTRFVGRRRELQAILAHVQAAHRQGRSGVLIQGTGGYGKSSLAARVIDRLPELTPVVLVGAFRGAEAVLEALGRRRSDEPVQTVVQQEHAAVQQRPEHLATVLRRLLEGACGGADGGKPILLILDDLEQILDDPPPAAGSVRPHSVKPAYVPVLRAVLEAFRDADTRSRLLLTSRYAFALTDRDGRDLAGTLLCVPLGAFGERTVRKQAALLAADPSVSGGTVLAAGLRDRCQAAAAGNPRLLTLLLSLGFADPDACAAAVTAMEQYLAQGQTPDGQTPDSDTVRAFLDDLVLDRLLGLLSNQERELLRAFTLFDVPIPLPGAEALAAALGVRAPNGPVLERLVGLALLDRMEDLVTPTAPSLILPPLLRPRAGRLSEAEGKALAKAVLPPLLAAWGGPDAAKSWPGPAARAVTELALHAGDVAVVGAVGWRAIYWLMEQAWDYQAAAALGRRCLALLDQAGAIPSFALLRWVGSALHRAGDGAAAEACLNRVLARPDAVEDHDGLILRLELASVLKTRGILEDAEKIFRENAAHFRERNDQRHTAVTMGKIADILQQRGQLDQALKIRQEQELPVYQQLGDVRSKAVAQAMIAQMLVLKDAAAHRDEALRLLAEAHAACAAMGIPEAGQIEQIMAMVHGDGTAGAGGG